jgi:DNA-binding MarR family transcriptional regulator
MRDSDHSKDLRLYEITSHGVIVQESLRGYQGVSTGVGEAADGARSPAYPGLTSQESGVLWALIELSEATIATLERRTGLPTPALSAALARLVSLGYAIQLTDEPEAAYRPVAHS